MGANLVRARDQERQFLLSVSHELRTPLTSIRGYADAVVDGATDDPTAAATVISAEARRLERLVRTSSTWPAWTPTASPSTSGPSTAPKWCSEVADGFRPRARQLGLELVTAPGSDVPLWVEADPRPARPGGGQPGGERLLLRRPPDGGGRRAPSGGRPVAWVSDDGPGIPADQLAKVFERHFVSDRVSGRRKGSGLGLAIVSELASAMGAIGRGGITGGRRPRHQNGGVDARRDQTGLRQTGLRQTGLRQADPPAGPPGRGPGWTTRPSTGSIREARRPHPA